jgi:KaiC/GvpD/RAD55 family RecA-like ATPase
VADAASIPNPNNREPRPPSDSPSHQQDDEWSPPQDVYELLSEPEIMSLPDPVFLIDGIVLSQSLGFIYGNPGAGKSFVALSMAMAIATNRSNWWDRNIKAHGPVLMIASEGVSDMKFRIQAWRKHHQIETESDLYLIRETINFLEPTDADKLHRTVDALIERTGGQRPAMVIVDTLSRAIAGSDENDQASASLMVQTCDAIKDKWQTVVVCIHHSSKQGSMRGSTVFAGAADWILETQREEGSRTGTINARKIKAAADGWQQGFSLLEVPLGSLEKPASSLVALPALVPKMETEEWPERARIALVLEAVQQAWNAGRPWSPYKQSKRTGTYIVSNMSRWNITEEHGEKLLETWMTNRVLSYEIYDAKTKQKGLKVVGGEAGGEGRRSTLASPPEGDFG